MRLIGNAYRSFSIIRKDEYILRVLVINGSPKGNNSNTMNLTRAFLDGAGWADAEIIDVSKTEVRGCLGCYACWNKTPGKCVLRDGMSDILPKIIAADVIVWSFPLYYFSIPGNLKNLIDRQLPLNLPFMADGNQSGGHPSRYSQTKQRYAVISTCGFWTAKDNYGAVENMFDRYYGAENYTAVFCGQGELFRVPELKKRTDEYLETVRRAGAEFAAGGILKETTDELSRPLYPRSVFEKMADASWGLPERDDGGENTQDDGSLNFTRQMAALYMPDGAERVLEFHYTDIEKSYQILLTAQGANVITDGFRPYTTKIETPYSLWRSISRGEIAGQDALFQKLYSVSGDFSFMLKWDELFGGNNGEPALKNRQTDKKPSRKTNMSVLLFPWILIWVFIAINTRLGGAVGIIAAASLPLLWLAFQPVIFERISVLLVAGISLLVLFGVDTRVVISASYGVFGLMWIIGAITKTPLTAYYSASGYGGEKALDNPLFIRTNRILTSAWGILYLITPIWTYIIMGTHLSVYIGLINSAVPVLMGIFTAWFQKWYPAQWAKS